MAVEQTTGADATGRLADVGQWLRRINEFAATSVLEALEEFLTLHHLKVAALLRQMLPSRNPLRACSGRCGIVKATSRATGTTLCASTGWRPC
jgi:hypothetical protein